MNNSVIEYSIEKLMVGDWDSAYQTLTQSPDIDKANPEIIKLRTYSELLHNGNISLQSNDAASAKKLIQDAISIIPEFASAYNLLGNINLEMGDYSSAKSCYQACINRAPDAHYAWCNLGISLLAQEQPAAAIHPLQKSLEIKPDFVFAHIAMGDALLANNQPIEGLEYFKTALALEPENFELAANIGNLYFQLGNNREAIQYQTRALILEPENPEIHYAIGNSYAASGDMDNAIKFFEKTISLAPEFGLAYNNLGSLLHTRKEYYKALPYLENAVQLLPDYSTGWTNLANAYKSLLDLKKACECYEHAIKLDHGNIPALSNYLYTLSLTENYAQDKYSRLCKLYNNAVTSSVLKFSQWNISPPSPTNPLRVGFVSGDFGNHPVGFFLEGLLPCINKSKISTIAFSTNNMDDSLSHRIIPSFSVWQDISKLSMEEAAQKIHSSGIHILIDLSGHTAHNILPAFAYKPAPVQVSWLGYWASTGMEAMDYLISDPTSIPSSQQSNFIEKIHYIPNTRFCFSQPEISPSIVRKPPFVDNQHITFGCFQSISKINDQVVHAWSQILKLIPSARLFIKSADLSDISTRNFFVNKLTAAGLEKSRLTVAGGSPRHEYLAQYNNIDIILDTFPFPGGTTTCEALWMGVPTITLSGETLIQRQGASILTAAGLSEWIVQDIDSYISLAQKTAEHPQILVPLRQQLRTQTLKSPLMNKEQFSSNLESCLYHLWHEKFSDLA